MMPSRDVSRLLEIMAALRHPETGCAWDLVQTASSIVPFTIEEAYEVAEAVERGDDEDLCDELGDLLLQVVFQARIAEEQGRFDFGGVVEAITSKLVRRHPHVFGHRRDLSPEQVEVIWAEVKLREKTERSARAATTRAETSVLSGVAAGLPPLPRAAKLQARAAKVGFDWNDAAAVVAKIREETDEVEAVLNHHEELAGEIGDLLFAVTNLARHAGIDPEAALRATNRKFERRFAFVESRLAARGSHPREAGLDVMEALWNEAKAQERGASRHE